MGKSLCRRYLLACSAIEIEMNGILGYRGRSWRVLDVCYTRGMKRAINSNILQEVSSARSTDTGKRCNTDCALPIGKEQIHNEPLSPHYVSGFIDGEGCFSATIGKNKTLIRKLEVRLEFSIELRADDREILERILVTIGAGKIYDCSYERYGWYPHAKYKIGNVKDMVEHLFPFLEKYPLQAKKARVYKNFREIVLMFSRKEHLSDEGFERILQLREEMRKMGKKAKTYGNR